MDRTHDFILNSGVQTFQQQKQLIIITFKAGPAYQVKGLKALTTMP